MDTSTDIECIKSDFESHLNEKVCHINQNQIDLACLHDINMFKMQVFLSTLITLFCITMIFLRNDTSIYLPLMTGIFGYWFPAPTRESTKITTQS
jgi:hypothetical protein